MRRPVIHFVVLCFVVVCLSHLPLARQAVKPGSERTGFSLESAVASAGNPIPLSTSSCGKTFVRYRASELEASWKSMISKLKSDEIEWEDGCDKIRQELEAHKKTVSGIKLHAARKLGLPSLWSLSSSIYVDNCTGKEVSIPIEPLVSFLRHPLAHCQTVKKAWWYNVIGGGNVDLSLDKSYLLVPFVDELGAQSSRKWLFDAGASTYDAGAGGASQSWFVNTYRERGFEFDHIYGWEAARTDPKEQWSTVPADIKRKTSWYNIPATTGIGDADNPLTFIKALTKPEDFVVFKLDIDAPAIEIALVQQIIDDPQLLTLIDEFYFEHHVTGSPMQWDAWGNLSTNQAPLSDIQDSYEIFSFLRSKGVRAHSWV